MHVCMYIINIIFTFIAIKLYLYLMFVYIHEPRIGSLYRLRQLIRFKIYVYIYMYVYICIYSRFVQVVSLSLSFTL